MPSEPTLHERLAEAKRVIKLRAEQMSSAAMCRDAGEINQDEWDGFAARYASAVREYRVLQHIEMAERPVLAETRRGATWVQQ